MSTPESDQLAFYGAQENLRAAFSDYIEAAKKATPQGSTLGYKPSGVLRDTHSYDLSNGSIFTRLGSDHITQSAFDEDGPEIDAVMLAHSPEWEDRIRASVLAKYTHQRICLPDNFPCIYEPAESPRRTNALHPRPFAWVVSPDMEMLEKLLPLYRELWNSYDAQWPHTSNREFAIGRLNGLPTQRVYRPGTTPEQVIGETLINHDMYQRAPLHLKKMHPQHDVWTAAQQK